MKNWYFFILLLCCSQTNCFTQGFNILDFGAIASDKHMDTDAIQQAIDSCYQSGGGEVRLPGGTYYTGTLQLRSHVYLNLSPATRLVGSSSKADYPNADYPHLIFAEDATRTGIIGQGTIDGQGLAFFDQSGKSWRPLEWRPEPWIFFHNCEQVKVSDIRLINSPAHVLVTQRTDDVTISGITIINDPRSPNTDGIDIKGGSRIRISDCYIDTGDDAICLKASQDTISQLVVHDCILKSDDAALKFGTGSRHLIEDCHFRDINIYDTRYGIAFFMTQGGIFRSATFDNIFIRTGGRHAYTFPIFIDNEARDQNYSNGQIENIHFSDLRIESSGNILICGQSDALLRNVSLENIVWNLSEIYPIPKKARKKPRGNKKYKHNPKAADLSNINAHFVFGFIEGLQLEKIQLQYENAEVMERDDRQLIYKKTVSKRFTRIIGQE
ncbi:MAG: glycosyl hydrolase family 28 protein [Bacteroidota bacterium]